MNSKFFNFFMYALQVVIIILIVLVALLIAKEAYELHSIWTPVLVAVLSAVVSIVFSLGLKHFWQHRRKVKLSNEYGKAKDVNFGINGYAFYDHDDCGYLKDLINIKLLDKPYTYDFGKTFAENAEIFPKMNQIRDLFCNLLSNKVPKEDIEMVVTNIINELQLSGNSIDMEVPTLILQSISKNREDIGNRLEASNLSVEVFNSNMATKKLIDAIYRYIKATYPRIIEASYKTNYKPENKKNLIEDFVCLTTTIGLYGCLVKKEGGKIEEAGYYLNTPRLVYGIRQDLTPDNVFKESNKVQYDELEEIMESSFDFPLKGKKYITDVIFEFDKDMRCYLLYTSQPDQNVKGRSDYSLIYTEEQFTKSFIDEATQTIDYKKQFYMCYAQSIVRKYENNRLK